MKNERNTHQEVAQLTNPTEMRLRLASSMVMDVSDVVGAVAIEAGKRSAVPGDRESAQQYRQIAHKSLEWLSERGVI